MFKSVLYFGRKNCRHSLSLKKILKKKTKKLYYVESKRSSKKIALKKIYSKNYSYIFCFRSPYILKKNLIKRANFAAINFHPGPPEYKGTGCVNYALYNNSNFYGVTCHLISEKIDSGKIIDVKKFKISKKDNVQSVLNKTYDTMLKQAIKIINLLTKSDKNLVKLIRKNKKVKWTKKIRKLKDLNKFYELKDNPDYQLPFPV